MCWWWTVTRLPGAPFGSTVTTRPSAASIVPRTRPVTTGAPGASGKSRNVTVCPVSPRISSRFIVCLLSPLLDDRQHVPGRVLEPGDVRASILGPPAQNAFLILLWTIVVALKPRATACEVIHRRIDVIDHEIQDGERRRLVIPLGIHKHCAAARQLKSRPHAVIFDFQSQRLCIEFPRGWQIGHRKAAERCLRLKHDLPPCVRHHYVFRSRSVTV